MDHLLDSTSQKHNAFFEFFWNCIQIGEISTNSRKGILASAVADPDLQVSKGGEGLSLV